jgi:hypothetical protein
MLHLIFASNSLKGRHKKKMTSMVLLVYLVQEGLMLLTLLVATVYIPHFYKTKEYFAARML